VKHAALLVFAVACGGEILGDPGDGAPDISQKPDASDASKDVAQALDAIVDVAPPPLDAPNPNACKIATTNLVAYFPLDTDTNDHTGHGNDATGANLATTQGIQGSAMHFDGATSSLQVTSGSAKIAGPRTLCAWMRQNATMGAGQPLFWAGQTNAGDFYAIFSTAPSSTTCTAPKPSVLYVDHWGFECTEPITTPTMVMKWSLVCYAYDGGAVEASIDGNEGKASGALYDYPMTTLFIGSTLGTGTTTKASFDGDIDEVSVWSVRLQAADLAALWNNGAGCTL
jgi:hypothetical protein